MGKSLLKALALFPVVIVLSACLGQSSESGRDVIVSPTSLTTSEDGSTASFSVSLSDAPTGNVVIDIVSRDTTEVTVDSSPLIFTLTNWSTPRTVTVTGIDDEGIDGNQNVTVLVETNTFLTEDTSGFRGLNPPDVVVTNIDDDIIGVTVTPTSLGTTEAGGTDTFSIVLNTPPDNDVVIDIASSDLTEGTVSPTQLTFTPTNWSNAQTVTVLGVDDETSDGNQTYSVTTDINAGLTTDMTGYAAVNPADVSVTNSDDDIAGITVTPMTGLTTNEIGSTASFTVVLNTEPDGDVVFDIASSDLTEGTVSPAQLTFTPANWSIDQTVTVAGVDDDSIDGNQTYAVTVTVDDTSGLTTDTTGYDAVNPIDVTMTNTDNDSAGVTVNPTVLSTNETGAGNTATFTIAVNTEPDSDVIIDIASSDTSEGTVSSAQLTFTAADWLTAQTVTVTGEDDGITDGNQTYAVVLAMNPSTIATGYGSIDPADVSVTNTDDDIAGVTVSLLSLSTNEAIGAGHSADFTVVLNTEPDGNVVIDIASSDTSEGLVSPSQLTFSAADWSTAQTVTVTAIDDLLTDGDQAYTVTLLTNTGLTTATGYDTVDPDDVLVTTVDDDIAGVNVTPTSLTTNEALGAGHTSSFTVRLSTVPDGDVVIDVASSDTSEGTVSPVSLSFTAADWSTPQTVTVTGVEDLIDDGNQTYTVTLDTNDVLTTATGYDPVDPADVSVTNIDNGAPGVTVNPTALTTNEALGAGHTNTFTVVLNTIPDGDVVIDVASSDTSEGTVSAASLTFTTATWSTAQTVTVTGVDDLITDGNQTYTITLDTNDGLTTASGYDPIDPADVSVTNTDDDIAGVTVAPTSLTTNEASGVGHTATFTVVLNTVPDGDVVIDVASSDLTEGTVSPASLSFTTATWSTAQTVTVTGVDDLVSDTNQTYTITLGTNDGLTTATGYDIVDPADVSVTNIDNGTPGVTVTPTSGLVTTEAGGTATFDLVLNTVPDGNVVIDVVSGDTLEGTVSPAQITFDSVNSSTPQTVTITGVDDGITDGNIAYTIGLTMNVVGTVATGYDSVDPADVAVTNMDDDAPSVTVIPISGLITTEAGGTATFDVVLNTIPDGNVIIDVVSDTPLEGIAAPAQLTFNDVNWSTAQTVTITGVDDFFVDSNQAYMVLVTMNIATAATGYATLNPDDVSVTNSDNDIAGVTVTPTSVTTIEAVGPGNEDTFDVVLNTIPDGNVVIDLVNGDITEGSIGTTQLTFTPADWSTAQTVTVTGVSEGIQDGDQVYFITLSMNVIATTDTTGYDTVNPDDVQVTSIDSD